jgi:hypothetical protein
VAWTLCALGNTIETVAGFVGHRNPQVTQDVYIAMSQSQRRQMVDCPWLRDVNVVAAGPTVREEGRAMAVAICSPFGSADGRTFPTIQFDAEPVTVNDVVVTPTNRRRSATRTATRIRRLLEEYLDDDRQPPTSTEAPSNGNATPSSCTG